jgi:hypothetical protein
MYRAKVGLIVDPIKDLCLLGFYAALKGDSVLTFRDNTPVPSSRVKQTAPFDTVCLQLDP